MRGFATAEGRDRKAAKIEAVLCAALDSDHLADHDIVDVGSGSGHIAAHLAGSNRVTAADIEDQIQASAPQLQFALLAGDRFPFDDGSFDIAVLNFVLMYVPDPLATPKETRRVLRPGGLCYVALPNRCFPIDPHVHLPFVSWLPAALYQPLVNRLRRTDERVRLFTPADARVLFEKAGFGYEDFTHRILHEPGRFHIGLPTQLPDWPWLTWLSPSNIFLLRVPNQP
ncbi:MAG: class I SAM-dependent methyltransferase [Rhodanobacteraceae bacterium]